MLMITLSTMLIKTLANHKRSLIAMICDSGTLTKWFYDNYMTLNPNKCHFMTIGFKSKSLNSIMKINYEKLSSRENTRNYYRR